MLISFHSSTFYSRLIVRLKFNCSATCSYSTLPLPSSSSASKRKIEQQFFIFKKQFHFVRIYLNIFHIVHRHLNYVRSLLCWKKRKKEKKSKLNTQNTTLAFRWLHYTVTRRNTFRGITAINLSVAKWCDAIDCVCLLKHTPYLIFPFHQKNTSTLLLIHFVPGRIPYIVYICKYRCIFIVLLYFVCTSCHP